MIASSTTMPIAIVSASRVKLLIEKPRKYMMANVATIDAGIASPGITVARTFRRNTKMINTTRIAAIRSVRRASLIRSEEHTSELQSRSDLVCRLLLEKKKHDTIVCSWALYTLLSHSTT